MVLQDSRVRQSPGGLARVPAVPGAPWAVCRPHQQVSHHVERLQPSHEEYTAGQAPQERGLRADCRQVCLA